MLTKKQLELLIFLEKKIALSSIPPSFEEMKSALNLKWTWVQVPPAPKASVAKWSKASDS